MKKIFLLLIIQIMFFSLKAQQEALYSVFWNNPSIYNPATTGEQSKYYGAINYRSQWSRIEGHPEDITALFEIRFDSINSAFGVSYANDAMGLEQSYKIGLNYSYHFKLPKDRKIGIGISPSYRIKQFDNQFVAIDDYHLDPSIPNKSEKYNYFDMNAGVSYLSKKFKTGIGATQILESDGGSNNLYKNSIHLFAHISYEIWLGNKFKLIPQTRIATEFSVGIIEASLIAKYNDRYWIGASYREDVALGCIAGVDIAKKVRLGYAFDYYTNNGININFGGSHEIVFAIILN